MSAIENVRRQISIHQRSLQILKEQQAKLGIYTPPNIIIDIEDTTAALDELQETLAELEKGGERTDTVVPAAQRRAQIYLDGNFATVSTEVKQAAIDAFAAVMGISPQEVKLFGVSAGSIIFDVGIPPEGADRLHRQLQRNSAQLRLLNVQRVSITMPGGTTQIWHYDDGQFRQIETPPPPTPKPGGFKKLLSLIRNLLLAGIVIGGGWWAFNAFNPPDKPVVVPPPTKTAKPVLPTASPTVAPELSIWLSKGCAQEYAAGSKTEIGIHSSEGGAIRIDLDGRVLFDAEIAPNEKINRAWVIPQDADEHLLMALSDSGTWAECPFSVYQNEPPQPEMTTEYDTDRPGMDIDNGFPALVDPDNTRGMEAYIEYCQTKCLENPECQAYTFLKEKNWCYLKFDAPDPVGNDCCVSGVKVTP